MRDGSSKKSKVFFPTYFSWKKKILIFFFIFMEAMIVVNPVSDWLVLCPLFDEALMVKNTGQKMVQYQEQN